MAPRGLKKTLRASAPATLSGTGKYKGFQSKQSKKKLRGLTKTLQSRLWSDGILPSIARKADASIRPKTAWKGKRGGITRGTKVDQQVSKLINGGKMAVLRQKSMFRLTRLTLSALAKHKLDPVMAQRSVVDEQRRLGTAADVICYDKKSNRLVMVELKCGYDHGRTAAAERGGRPCKMQSPCSKASDCNLHRHLAQLAVTREMFVREKATLKKLGDLGIEQTVDGLLLYVNDEGAEFFVLNDWWKKKASKILVGL